MSGNPYDAPQQFEPVYPELTSEVRNWGMLCHLIALLAMPFGAGHIVGPLIVWLVKRDEHPFIDDQGKESLNFQISMTIYGLVLVPLMCLLIGFPLLIALGITNIVFIVIASVKASGGEAYRYPLTIRFLK